MHMIPINAHGDIFDKLLRIFQLSESEFIEDSQKCPFALKTVQPCQCICSAYENVYREATEQALADIVDVSSIIYGFVRIGRRSIT
jgi:hypothetical protein